MANDRIWIVCTSCGEKKLITKYYPHYDLGELWEPGTLEPWVIEHLRHHPHQKHHLNNNPGLVIMTDGQLHGASGEIVEAIAEQMDDLL